MQTKSLKEKKLSEVMGGDVVRIKLLKDWAVEIIQHINEIIPQVEKTEIHYIKLWSDTGHHVYSIRELSGIKKFLMDRFEISESEISEFVKH